MTTLLEYESYFEQSGGTDFSYLRCHFPRYIETKRRVLAHSDRTSGLKLLDVGAHWLHQALLYAIDGFKVTALDFPATFELAEVRALAQAHDIQLLPNTDLEHPTALHELPDNSFDLVLFTEIIEHIAFNPVVMWREIYRVMKPGARIVLTTPNYYALRKAILHMRRLPRGLGGGVSVEQILSLKTLSHHWKEYSLRELLEYFRLLSPDFRCVNAAYVQYPQPIAADKWTRKVAYALEQAIPPLRLDLYLEIELVGKDHGVVIEPRW